MANPTNEEFINRIMQAESGGRRYDKNGKLLEGPKTRKQGTGKGEMQVVDKTNLDPGFGVTPAKNKSPDERARVGKDYAQAMLDRYDNQQHAAMAYNWGPGNVDKWLAKGQAAPVPKETEDYVVKVTGAPIQTAKKAAPAASPFDTAAAPAPVVAAGAPKASASPPVVRKAEAPAPVVRKAEAPTQDMKARIAALGPNYHAAMALSYLADNTDEDDPAIQEYRERMGEESERSAFLSEPVASPAIADLDLKVRSPFPEPVAAARGGLIHRAKGSPEEGETGYFQDPMGVADSGPVTADTRAPSKAPSARAMLDMAKEVGSGTLRNVKNLALGAADVPYDFAGIPVDLTTMTMRPFGYKVEKPIMGSDWLKEQATERGLRVPESKDERDQGFRLAGEIGAGLVNPASAVRGGVKAGAKAADMLKDVATSEAAYNLAQKAVNAPGSLAKPMYITRQPGGEFPTKGPKSTALGEASSYKSQLDEVLDRNINDLKTTANRNPAVKDQAEAVSDFFDTKLRNWYTKQAGSVSDPVRESLINGKIKLPKDSKAEEQFPQALLDAARKGDTTAMKLIEDKYDNMVGVRGHLMVPDDPVNQYVVAERERGNYARNILSSMKDNPSTIPDSMLLRLVNQDVATLSPKEAAQKVATIRGKLAENPNWFNTVLEPKIQRMISTDSYEMPNIVKQSSLEASPERYAALLQTEKTKTGQAPAYDISGTYGPNLFGMDRRQLQDAALQMDTKDLSRMSVPEFMAKAMQINKAGSEAEQAATTVKKAVEMRRPIPSNAAMYGTKELLPKDTQGYQWREVVDPMATKIQAAMVKNSIAGYSELGTYGSAGSGIHAIKNGDVRIFSLYSPEGHAVTNVEYLTPKYVSKKDQWHKPNTMPQFRGNGLQTGNVSPEDYAPQVRDLINFIKPDKVDTLASSVLESSGLINDISPDALKIQYPQRRAMGGAVERQSYDNRRYL